MKYIEYEEIWKGKECIINDIARNIRHPQFYKLIPDISILY